LWTTPTGDYLEVVSELWRSRKHPGVWFDFLDPRTRRPALPERRKIALTPLFVSVASEVSPLFWCTVWPDFNLYIPANALIFTVTLALAWMGS